MKHFMFFFMIIGLFFSLYPMDSEETSSSTNRSLSPSTLLLPPYTPQSNHSDFDEYTTEKQQLKMCLKQAYATLGLMQKLLENKDNTHQTIAPKDTHLRPILQAAHAEAAKAPEGTCHTSSTKNTEDEDCPLFSEEDSEAYNDDDDDEDYSNTKKTFSKQKQKKIKRLVQVKPKTCAKKPRKHNKRTHIKLSDEDVTRLTKLKGMDAETLWQEHLKDPLCKDLSRKGRFIEGTFLPCFENECIVNHTSQACSFGQTISTHLSFVRKGGQIPYTHCPDCGKKVNSQATAMVYHWILTCKVRSQTQTVAIPKQPMKLQCSGDGLE